MVSVPETVDKGVFAKLGRFVVHRPWWVIGAWVLLAVVVIATAPALTQTSEESDALPRDYESIQASTLGQQAFPSAFTPSMLVVFQRADGGKLTQADSDKEGRPDRRRPRQQAPQGHRGGRAAAGRGESAGRDLLGENAGGVQRQHR